MNMTPRFQKFALLAHITFSVGWFGAILPYLALVIAGLTNNDPKTLQFLLGFPEAKVFVDMLSS